MNPYSKPKMPFAQIVYGEVIYWIAIVSAILCMIGPLVSMASVENNVLNPHYLFSGIFEGKDAKTIWTEVGGGEPHGHWYLEKMTFGDGLTMIGLALGCSSALWGLLIVTVAYLKEKNYLYVFLALWVGLLIFLAMAGIVESH